MVTAGENSDFIFFHLINQTVFAVDPAGPAAGKFVFEGFGFAGSDEWIPLNLPDHFQDAQGFLAVLFDPPCKIFKPGWIKFQASCRLRQGQCLFSDF